MKITRKKPNKQKINDERVIVRGAVTSTSFLEQFHNLYESNTIVSSEHRLIINWCLEYFKLHKAAPGNSHMSEVFQDKTKGMDDEEIGNIEAILEYLSSIDDESDKFSTSYALERSTKYMNDRKIEILIEAAQEDPDSAIQLIADFKKIEKSTAKSLRIFTHEHAINNAFKENKTPLFTVPGKIGKLLNSQFTRGAFIGFLGREKIGKTWFLVYLLEKAMRSRANVAFFEVGDMSKNQIIRRIAIQTAGLSDNRKFLNQSIPVIDCIWNQIGRDLNSDNENDQEKEYPSEKNNRCTKKYRPQRNTLPVLKITEKNEQIFRSFENNLDHVPCRYCLDYTSEGKLFIDGQLESDNEYNTRCRKESRFNSDIAKKRQEHARKINNQFKFSTWYKKPEEIITESLDGPEANRITKEWYKKYKKPIFELSVHPTLSINVNGIRKILLSWQKESGFHPDVLFVDYPDILLPNNDRDQYRHAQNDTWASLRALSLELDICVIVVTQADAKSYNQSLLDLSNFSEDKRKYSHVTSFFGLNQTTEDKKRHVMRINTLLARETDFDSRHYVTVLQDLSRGKFIIDSF